MTARARGPLGEAVEVGAAIQRGEANSPRRTNRQVEAGNALARAGAGEGAWTRSSHGVAPARRSKISRASASSGSASAARPCFGELAVLEHGDREPEPHARARGTPRRRCLVVLSGAWSAGPAERAPAAPARGATASPARPGSPRPRRPPPLPSPARRARAPPRPPLHDPLHGRHPRRRPRALQARCDLLRTAAAPPRARPSARQTTALAAQEAGPRSWTSAASRGRRVVDLERRAASARSPRFTWCSRFALSGFSTAGVGWPSSGTSGVAATARSHRPRSVRAVFVVSPSLLSYSGGRLAPTPWCAQARGRLELIRRAPRPSGRAGTGGPRGSSGRGAPPSPPSSCFALELEPCRKRAGSSSGWFRAPRACAFAFRAPEASTVGMPPRLAHLECDLETFAAQPGSPAKK